MSLQLFRWMEVTCIKAAELLQGDSLILTTKFQGLPDTHLIDVTRMKGCVKDKATYLF